MTAEPKHSVFLNRQWGKGEGVDQGRAVTPSHKPSQQMYSQSYREVLS